MKNIECHGPSKDQVKKDKTKSFTKIWNAVIDSTRLTTTEKMTLVALLRDDESFMPAIPILMIRVQCSKNVIFKVLKSLEEKGIIKRKKEYVRDPGTGITKSRNIYILKNPDSWWHELGDEKRIED